MNVSLLMSELMPYAGNIRQIKAEQSTGDIIEAITRAHKAYQVDYAKIAKFFKGATVRDTARNIYNFLKQNIKYKIEPGSAQTVKSPAALLAHGYGDCKHYSKFAAGILENLGIPYAYRFASYKIFDPQPGHVFVVVNPGTANELWIDPVLPKFDQKKEYQYATDKNMAIYSISGVGQVPAAKTKKEQRQTKQAARKAAGKTVGQKLAKGAKIVAKVAASPARNAFLLLVKINFANLGVKLAKAWEKAPSKVRNFWEAIGGNLEALKKAWEAGKTKRRILGIETNAEIGAAPAAAATAAAPILVKVATVLKDIGIDPAELVQIGKDAANAKVQQLAKEKLVPGAQKEASNLELADEFDAEIEQAPAAPAAKKINVLPLVIGGVAIAYFLTRKK